MKLERLLLASLLCAPALAVDLADLEGTFKRINSETKAETVLRLELDDDGVYLNGTLEGLPQDLECTGRFKLKGDVLRGWVRWVDTKYGTDSKVPWKFTFKDGDTARGSCGWLDTSFEPFKRGYTIYFLERTEDAPASDSGSSFSSGTVRRDGWQTGDGGELPASEEINGGHLYGGWRGPGGPWLVNSSDGESLTIKPVDHSEGVELRLQNEDGVWRGEVSYDGGTSEVELAWTGERLVGRSSWSEGDDQGWAPLSFERLERIDLGHPSEVYSVDPGSDAEIAGAYKREDGLYLRLDANGEGELVAKDGTRSCRVRLENQDGVWTGTANWDGVETKWELARTDDGLEGRSEWVDHDGGTVVVRGWSKRAFQKLERAF